MAKLVDRKDHNARHGVSRDDIFGGRAGDCGTSGGLGGGAGWVATVRDRAATRRPVSLLAMACLIPAALSLAACGGGGGGPSPGAITTTLPPAPPPPPPPPPETTGSTPFAVKVLHTGGGATYADAFGPRRDGLFTVTHDAASDVYVLTSQRLNLCDSCGGVDALSAAQATFRPQDRVAGPEPTNYSYYGSTPTGPALTLLKNAPDNTRIALTYLSYGVWNADGSHTVTFLVGPQTPAADAPRTGSATYHGIVDGYVGTDRLLGSTGALTADFAAGSVTTTLTLHANAFDGALSGTGTIGAGTSRFDGRLTGTLGDRAASGRFLGGFYGPGASEAGYAFTAWDDPLGDFVAAEGVFVGKR